MKRRQAAALLALPLLPVGAARAGVLTDLIRRAKPSIVLVGTYGLTDSPRFGFRGTGFAVGNGQRIVTNVHVLPGDLSERVDQRLVVQTWSAKDGWTMRDAQVEKKNAFFDLAVLSIDGPPLPALQLATEDPQEGTDVVLIGFPLGGALGFTHVAHRGMVAARVAIAQTAANAQMLQPRALQQLRQGSFEVLQLDATAYPGNSGGPVLDATTGQVVGVVNMVLVKGTREAALSAPSGISYALKASTLASLLAD